MRKFGLILFAVAFACAAGCDERADRPAHKTARDQGETERAHFVADVAGRLAELEHEIALLEETGIDPGLVAPLRAKQRDARRLVNEALRANGPDWAPARERARRAVVDLEIEYAATIDRGRQ